MAEVYQVSKNGVNLSIKAYLGSEEPTKIDFAGKQVETTLHHQLKDLFREPNSPVEVQLGSYRIDLINGDRLVEIQRSGLASIRSKVENLLDQGFKVDIVKPLVKRKQLVKLSSIQGKEIDRRWSPLNGSVLDIFDELLYFTRVYPHPRLRLLAPLVTIEEIRYPGHGRRRRRRDGDFMVKDRHILELHETHTFNGVEDLHQILDREKLPPEFDTQQLADNLAVKRFEAQKVAYVMRKVGAFRESGKRGNAHIYRLVTKREAKKTLLEKERKQPGQSRAVKKMIKAAIEKHARKAG